MGREARAKRERRDPLAKAMKRALRAVENRKSCVEAQLRTKEFESALKLRVDLLQGTPGEITSDLAAGRLAVEVLTSQGVDCDGVQVACALRMRRLQFFVTVSPQARSAAADEARAQAKLRAAFAA